MTTLIFVHGFWTTPRIWEPYQSYFNELGYQTKALALPQHFSRNQPQHPEGLSLVDYLDYLEEEFRAVSAKGGKVVVAGHGMGAVLALQLAMRVDPDALLLISPEAPSSIGTALPPTRALVEACTTPFFWKRGIKPTFRAARDLLFNKMSNEKAAQFYEYLCYESGQAIHQAWFWYLDTKSSASIEREKISCPIMTIAGSDDQYCSARVARRLARHLGQGRHFHRLQGFGHMLPLEDNSFTAARQMHVWLCWQLGMQSNPNAQTHGLNTATV